MKPYRDIALTPTVEAVQTQHGSRHLYARAMGRVVDRLGPAESAFIAARNSFYVASINANGWPYIQHRGGPRGFVRVLGPTTLAFADFSGNRQYLTVGNVADDDRVALFFMNYAEQMRLKAFARARTIEVADAAPELLAAVADPSYDAEIERVVIFEIEAFNWNCPQHIPVRYDADEVEQLTQPLRDRIVELEARLAATPGGSPGSGAESALPMA